MKLKNKLSGVQVSVPAALADDLLEKGSYLTPADYDEAERVRAAAERDRLARKAGALGDEDQDDDPDPDAEPAKETAAAKRKREAAEKAEREAAEKAAADAAAAAAAGN